jgi:hypothetical protein
MYSRINKRVFFLLPAVACGFDEEGYLFFEVAFMCFSFGVGCLQPKK